MTDTTIATSIDSQPLLLDVRNATLHVTTEQFDRLCIDNPDLRLEMTKDGKLQEREVEIYRSGKEVEILTSPTAIDCNDVMPGFSLQMSKIW